MRSPRLVTTVLFGFACVSPAAADNWITSWGDGDPNEDFRILQVPRTITILRGDGNTYKFYAEDPPGSPGTGVINNITVHKDATGDFSILIEHELGGPGALDWNEGNLTYAGGTSTVTGVKVDGGVAGWPILRAAKGGGAIPARRCAESSAMCGGGY